jgi:hypothetical protein
MFSRIIGGGDKGLSRHDVVEIYVAALRPEGSRFYQLTADAKSNLAAAYQLERTAVQAAEAPRLSMNDVVIIEGAIQSLREQRQIFRAAAKALKKEGETINDDHLREIRDDYGLVIKSLGKTADMLADRIDEDVSATFARPDRGTVSNFSGS